MNVINGGSRVPGRLKQASCWLGLDSGLSPTTVRNKFIMKLERVAGIGLKG
jgi:hypothetical protein